MSVVAPAASCVRAQQLAALGSPQLGAMLGVAAMIALLAGAWIWGQTRDSRVLYANFFDRDGGLIISSLQQKNVAHKFAGGGGALPVVANQVRAVCLRLESQGLPKISLAGFDLMESQNARHRCGLGAYAVPASRRALFSSRLTGTDALLRPITKRKQNP